LRYQTKCRRSPKGIPKREWKCVEIDNKIVFSEGNGELAFWMGSKAVKHKTPCLWISLARPAWGQKVTECLCRYRCPQKPTLTFLVSSPTLVLSVSFTQSYSCSSLLKREKEKNRTGNSDKFQLLITVRNTYKKIYVNSKIFGLYIGVATVCSTCLKIKFYTFPQILYDVCTPYLPHNMSELLPELHERFSLGDGAASCFMISKDWGFVTLIFSCLKGISHVLETDPLNKHYTSWYFNNFFISCVGITKLQAQVMKALYQQTNSTVRSILV